jgi:murein DD-endopeptidase MepM/ murein hydrolase activator NlpD
LSAGTCSPGSVLLQPRRIRLAAVDSTDAALVQDLVAVALRFASDTSSGATMAGVLEEAAQALGTRLVDRAGGGIERAVQHLQDLLRPVVSVLQELEAVDATDPAAVENALADLLSKLAAAIGGLSLDRLRVWFGKLLDVIQQDLGLTSAAVQEQAWAFIEDIIARLEAVPAGDDPEARVNRLNMAGLLRRVERRVKEEFALPEINADLLATALFDELRRLGLGEALARLACVGQAADAGITIAKDVLHLVPFTGFGSHSIGAGEGGNGAGAGANGTGGSSDAETRPATADVEYLWYPSWLLASTNRDHWYQIWRFGADFWIDRRGAMNQVKRDTQRLFLSDAFDWSNIPVGSDDVLAGKATTDLRPLSYTFKKKTPEDMESWARHSAWIADGLEALLHLWSPTYGVAIKKGGELSATDFMHVVWDGGNSVWKAATKKPWRFWLLLEKDWQKHWYSKFASYIPTAAVDTLGALQLKHTQGSAFTSYLIQEIFDAFNILGDMAIPALFRDLFLSYFTIRNYEGPREPPAEGPDTRPDNRLAIDGITFIPMFFVDWFFTKVIFPRKYYGHPFTGDSTNVSDWSVQTWVVWCLVGGIVSGIFGGFLGWGVGLAVGEIVGSPAKDIRNFAYPLLKAILRIGSSAGGTFTPGLFDIIRVFPMSFWLFLYSIKENDTGGGTYNPFGASSRADFKGYADSADSPYKLPWASDKTYLCVQGNLGMWSHNFTNPAGEQVYAYDFTLDKGEEILAARSGTVVDWFDSVPDDQDTTTASSIPTAPGQTASDNWNFVMIRHDQPSSNHDLGPGPPGSGGKYPAVTTYGIYGHGQQGSVQQAFAARSTSVAPAAIIGTVVQQGEPIMLADNTGTSFLDHVHIEVRPGPAPPPAGTPTTPVNRNSAQIGQTLPFVFTDVPAIGAIGISSGNPQSKHYYESGNQRKSA